MTDFDDVLEGLLAVGGAVVTGWLYIEARKALQKAWQENNLMGVLLSASAMGAAYGGYVGSVKKVRRILKLPANTGRFLPKRNTRNPFLLPEYPEYPQ